jgi:hypothetical protein
LPREAVNIGRLRVRVPAAGPEEGRQAGRMFARHLSDELAAGPASGTVGAVRVRTPDGDPARAARAAAQAIRGSVDG